MSRHHLLSGLAIAVTAATGACGSGPPQTMPRRHLSATAHHTEAERHDREASAGERTAQVRRRGEASGGGDEYGCYDREVPDPDLGGERVQVLRPCWTEQTRQASPDRTDAAEHRRLARKHREQADALTRAERRACRGLRAAEIERGPFSAREEVARVEPLESDGRTIGARVLFRRARGLDPERMRRAVACHQARAAALGYPPRVMSESPLMVAPTVAVVDARGDLIAVTITARRDEDAAAVLGRARALLRR
jgi:hypothetical protein